MKIGFGELMKIYADLNLKSNLSIGADSPIDMIDMASRLGYSYVCLADFDNFSFKEIREVKDKLKSNVRVLTRIDIVGEDIKVIKQRLRSMRSEIDIIGLKCKDKAIFNWAIQDSRIDLMTFFDYSNLEILTYEAAKLANRNSKPIELIVRPLIINSGLSRSKQLRLIRKIVDNIVRANTPFIITSGAHSIYELRAARELVSVLNLVDLPKELCIRAVTEVPLEIIKNRGQLSES